MKVITWNVNSIKARNDRLFALLERHKPDALCLQEIKVSTEAFPMAAVQAAGYHAAVLGQKTYNGVAILSRSPPEDVTRNMDDGVADPQARLVSAKIDGVRIISAYVPNGSEVGSDKYAYKLEWLRRLRAWLDKTMDPKDPIALCGDMNVAPEDIDVARPAEWKDTVLCHEDARAALARVCAFGFEDGYRVKHPGVPGHYSWWDYRALGFPRNNGLRIDHVLVTRPLVPRVTDASIDRNERKGEGPSDHAPVIVDFDA
jgi:exodeoxyribonuclease-3